MQRAVFDYRTNEFKSADNTLRKGNDKKNNTEYNDGRLPFVVPGKFYLPIWR